MGARKQMTVEELVSLEDEELDATLIEIIGDRIYGEDARYQQGVPMAHAVAWVTSVVEYEVTNGSFLQFFYNTHGALNPLLPEALQAIDAEEYLPCIQQAIALFDRERSWFEQAWEHDRATESLEKFSAMYAEPSLADHFQPSRDFCALEEAHPLWEKRVRYLRAHIEEFRELVE